MIIPPVFYDS